MSAGTGCNPGEVTHVSSEGRTRPDVAAHAARAGRRTRGRRWFCWPPAATPPTSSRPAGPVTQAGSVVTGATDTAAAVPLGPGGIPIASRDRPVQLPLYDNNPPIESGLPMEKGPLKVYNWADYIDPETVKKFEKQYNTKVEITTFQNEDEAMAKLQTGQHRLRRHTSRA